jgi:hypothetical protein
MEHRASGLEHSGEFREGTGQVLYVLENVRREHNIEGGVRKRQGVSAVCPDVEYSSVEVGRGF